MVDSYTHECGAVVLLIPETLRGPGEDMEVVRWRVTLPKSKREATGNAWTRTGAIDAADADIAADLADTQF